jgi:hemoglobin
VRRTGIVQAVSDGELPDIEDRDDCERLVRTFYGAAMEDELIGWIFTDIAHLDLEEHVPVVTSFWETVLLGNQSYYGGAFGVHAKLHEKAGLRKAHFQRWLVLWCRTVDELFDGERAAMAKVHGLRVANAFHGRLASYPGPEGASGLEVQQVRERQ